jgi:hypothetical protein
MIDIVVNNKTINVTNKSNEITLTGDDNNILVEIEQRNMKTDFLAKQDIGINFFGIPYDILNVVYADSMAIFIGIEPKLSNTLYVVRKNESILAIYLGDVFIKEIKVEKENYVGFPYIFPFKLA